MACVFRVSFEATIAFHAGRSPGPTAGVAAGVRTLRPVLFQALPLGRGSLDLGPARARGIYARSMRPEYGCIYKAAFLVSREGRGRGFSLGSCLAIYFGPLSSTAGCARLLGGVF